MRKPVVGVMGGANVSEDVVETARRLGSLIAKRNWVLLNGGCDQGVMAASARGAREMGGVVIGVLPDRDAGRASPDLDFAICTNMGDARNLINVLSSDVVIACRGAAGTFSEVALALKNGKPVILLGLEVGPVFDRYRERGLLASADGPEEAVDQAAAIIAGAVGS